MLNDNAKKHIYERIRSRNSYRIGRNAIIHVIAASPNETERIASDMVVRGDTYLYGREVISACVL